MFLFISYLILSFLPLLVSKGLLKRNSKSPPTGGDINSPTDGCSRGVLVIKLIVAGFICAFKLPDCGTPPSYSDMDKKVMQYILKDTAKKLESIFVQAVDTSELCYHHLFETFQNDVLLLDAEMGAIPSLNNQNGLLTFSKLNKNSSQDLAILSAGQQVTSEDRLFLFHFDPNSTEKREDINLPGIDQLPAIIDEQVQGTRSRDDVANLIHNPLKDE